MFKCNFAFFVVFLFSFSDWHVCVNGLNRRIWHLGSFWVILIDLYCCVGVMLMIMNKPTQRHTPCFFTAENNVFLFLFSSFFSSFKEIEFL